MDRPKTTLFMLQSLDGKISTGSSWAFDFEKDLPNIEGVGKGLKQFYKIRKDMPFWAFTTGKTQAKFGANVKELSKKSPVNLVVYDNHYLTKQGIEWLSSKYGKVVIVTLAAVFVRLPT